MTSSSPDVGSQTDEESIYKSFLFSDVTARVPEAVLGKFVMAEHLPYLVKLTTGLTVSILVGEEDLGKVKASTVIIIQPFVCVCG